MGLGAHPSEGSHRLGQDFPAVGHKQHTAIGKAVKSRQKCLAQPGGENHQPGPVPVCTGGSEASQGLDLDRMGQWRGNAFFAHDFDGYRAFGQER